MNILKSLLLIKKSYTIAKLTGKKKLKSIDFAFYFRRW